VWRTLRAILIAPVTVAVVIPAVITLAGGARALPGLPTWLTAAALLIGAVLITVGIALLAWTVWLFHTTGKGTLAPFDPPKRLVVRGPYRHVRNPMITGVVSILFGEAFAFQSPGLLIWAATFLLINMIYFPLVEERGLSKRFGPSYEEYRRNVPRWLPRPRAWSQPADREPRPRISQFCRRERPPTALPASFPWAASE
jgi:protein-S-isoprenylcysteine O-methyltransferase Ste14